MLSARVDFILIAVREKGDTVDFARLGEVFRQIYAVDIDERSSPDTTLPAQVRGHQSAALRATVAEVARVWRPDLLQVEYTHMAAFTGAAPGVPSILVEHDVTFQLYRQLAASKATPEAAAEYSRWLAFEKDWLSRCSAVWTVSPEDRASVLDVSSRSAASTFVVPNGVDIRRFAARGAREDASAPPSILYVGSFRHLPNLVGFEALMRYVMPRVWKLFPEALLTVVAGPHHDRYWNKPSPDPRAQILGFVEDLRPLYAQASAVVIPLEVSAGTNIKVLEAMACGKSIVSTSVGCAGLGLQDGTEILIRDAWDDFADAVTAVLSGSNQTLGTHARRTAEDCFSWTAIADTAFDAYRSLLEAGQREAAS